MRELHVPSGVAAEYFFGIFRGYEDTTFVAGLADVRTSVDFDDKLDVLEEVWNKTWRAIPSSSSQFFVYS